MIKQIILDFFSPLRKYALWTFFIQVANVGWAIFWFNDEIYILSFLFAVLFVVNEMLSASIYRMKQRQKRNDQIR